MRTASTCSPGWSSGGRPCGHTAGATPHPGEMSRLTGMTVDEIERDRLAAARDAAQRWGQVVVLKGAETVVASPDGRAAISPFANPALASAGTGDVLAGAVVGLLAQGLDAPTPLPVAACICMGWPVSWGADRSGRRGWWPAICCPCCPRRSRRSRVNR